MDEDAQAGEARWRRAQARTVADYRATGRDAMFNEYVDAKRARARAAKQIRDANRAARAEMEENLERAGRHLRAALARSAETFRRAQRGNQRQK